MLIVKLKWKMLSKDLMLYCTCYALWMFCTSGSAVAHCRLAPARECVQSWGAGSVWSRTWTVSGQNPPHSSCEWHTPLRYTLQMFSKCITNDFHTDNTWIL